jgi:hypothetical protein
MQRAAEAIDENDERIEIPDLETPRAPDILPPA